VPPLWRHHRTNRLRKPVGLLMPDMPTTLRGGVLAALLLSAGSSPALAQTGADLPVHEVLLDNGLRVLVLEKRGSPTVATVMRFKVGGVNEVRGQTGIAHLLEHLLFKGTSEVGTTNVVAERLLFAEMDSIHEHLLAARGMPDPDMSRISAMISQIRALEDSARSYVVSNEFDRILSTAGARGLNATTDSEATTYFIELPANRLELWFAMESDRMKDPVFREFYSERDVVAEERRLRTETQAAGRLLEAHSRAAYTVHPYGQPVVGWMSDIQRLTRSEAESYHTRYYGPNNAVLSIVGDVDATQVLAWARKYFGDIGAGDVPAPVNSPEPEQRGERRVDIEFDAEPAIRIGWHVPSVFSSDMPTLIMLSTLLTGGRTSRLHSRLVLEDRVAAGVTTSIGPGSRYPQLFSIDASPRAPATTRDIEEVIYSELAMLAEAPPSLDELQRIRNQYEAGEFRRLMSNLGVAFQLAESEALFGDWRRTFGFSARIANVTPEAVSEVVRRYFTRANRTVATLVTKREPGN
jgi:predicted Zn-dependent peptidase